MKMAGNALFTLLRDPDNIRLPLRWETVKSVQLCALMIFLLENTYERVRCIREYKVACHTATHPQNPKLILFQHTIYIYI